VRIKALVLPGLAAVVVAALALSLAHSRASSAGAKSSASVSGSHGQDSIKGYAFMPTAVTVKVGARITWTNHDATAHTATADQGGFDTGTINPGQSKTIDFKHLGTYTYHCAFHAFMTGTVKVVGR
jgi:plastocyanin